SFLPGAKTIARPGTEVRWLSSEDMDDREREEIGRTVGMGTGFAGGAALGARIIPVPVVGPFVGGVLGAAVGGQLGRRFGKALLRGGEACVASLTEGGGPLALPPGTKDRPDGTGPYL